MTDKPSTKTAGERITRLEDAFVRIEDQVGKTNQTLERFIQDSSTYRESQLKSKQTNWLGLIGAICVILGLMFSVFIAAIGLLWMVITMQINSNVEPVRGQLTSVFAQLQNVKNLTDESHGALNTIVSQNSTSIKDRDDMRRDLLRLAEEESLSKSERAMMKVGLREVETQFHKSQDESNLQHAHELRSVNQLQNALHQLGATIPEAASGPYYFPSVPTQQPLDGNK